MLASYRTWALLALTAGGVAFLGLGAAASSPCAAEEPPLQRIELRIAKEGWGAAEADVRKVLESAAGELLRHFPEAKLPPIEVQPKGGPIVLFRRAPDGAIRMRLDTGDTYWSQYAFQFSHELCHILCQYDEDPTGNKWFEESCCEMASLFALRRMAATWQSRPPYPNWRSYAKALEGYAQERLSKAALPEGTTLAAWYAEHAEYLGQNATDREKNAIVAAALLPLFEREPARWQALYWINAARPQGPQSFRDFLADWRRHSPPAHRDTVEQIAQAFAVEFTPER